MSISYKKDLKMAFCRALEGYLRDLPLTNRLRLEQVSYEYPIVRNQVPAIWVGFTERQLEPVGVDTEEMSSYPVFNEDGSVTPIDPLTEISSFTRWRFQGDISLTVVALTSVDRDELSDLLVEAVMLSTVTSTSGLLGRLELDSTVTAKALWPLFKPIGESTSMGTPWGEDIPLYESSYKLPVLGEITSEPLVMTNARVEHVVEVPYLSGEEPIDDGEGGWV